jgi:serine phosphatase RsbU (regulator of sigma subunit)
MTWWTRLSRLGLKESSTRGKTRRAQITNRMLFISTCVGFSYIPIFISLENGMIPLIFNIVLTLCISSLFLFSWKGRHQIAGVTLCLLLTIHIVVISVFIQGGTARYYLIQIAILGFALIRSLRIGTLLFIFAAISFFIAEYAYKFIEPLMIRNGSDHVTLYIFNMTVIFLAGYYLIYHLKKTNDNFESDLFAQRDQIEKQHKVLEESHAEIQDSIRYAKRIQSAILPSEILIQKLIPDSFIMYQPKDIVAGDFYWLEENNGHVLIAAADCTGHGVPGALVSVVCNNALNRSVHEHEIIEPNKILDKTRSIVVEQFEKSHEDVKDGMDIALCSIKDKKLIFSGAHNPLWILRKEELIEFKGDRQPVGKFEHAKPYTSHEFDVQTNDMIYLFTDGFADQFGGERGKKFGLKALRILLKSIHNLSVAEQKKALSLVFQNWMGELEQVDDVCFIGLRIS